MQRRVLRGAVAERRFASPARFKYKMLAVTGLVPRNAEVTRTVKLSVILPAYNEERTIAEVLDAVLGVDLSSLPEPVEKEVIVVDDASADRTVEVIRKKMLDNPRIKLLCHKTNQGKGAAVQTALEKVTGDIVLIQDADLEYSVEDYPALLRPFFEEGAQVVYGSRFLKRRHPTGMRRVNLLANRILTFCANLLYGMKITDEATCLKLFRAEIVKSLPLKARGFDFCPEVTALVRLRGAEIKEVPIEYNARTHAEGKKVRWSDGVQAFRTLLAYRILGKRREPHE